MRIKVYLNPKRDLELIAIRFNPALDFGGIAKEVLRSHVRNEKYSISLPRMVNHIKRSMTCYVVLDDKEDADVIAYLDKVVISNSAFIRNIMVRAISNDISYLYTDKNLKTAITTYELEKKRKANKENLKKRLEHMK